MEKTGSETEILFEEIQQFTRSSVRDFIKVLLGIVFIALVVSVFFRKEE